VCMILATGMRTITWTTVVTVAAESHLVPAGAAGNCDSTVEFACFLIFFKYFLRYWVMMRLDIILNLNCIMSVNRLSSCSCIN